MIRFYDFPPKDPSDKQDYTLNLSSWLAPAELVTSAVWTAPSGITLGTGSYGSTISPDGKKVTVWLLGGASGQQYLVALHFVTSNTPPREEDAELYVVVQET